MSENQAFLVLVNLVSKGDLAGVVPILQGYSQLSKLYVLGAILLFTPELQDPQDFVILKRYFLNTQNSNSKTTEEQYDDDDDDDVIVNLIADDPKLAIYFEVGPDIIADRVHFLKEYISQNGPLYGFSVANGDFISFVRARVHRTFSLNRDIHFNDPLILLLGETNSDIQLWLDNVIYSYEYLESLTTSNVSLWEFENLSQYERFTLLLKAVQESGIGTIANPLHSFVASSEPSMLLKYLQDFPLHDENALFLLDQIILRNFPNFKQKSQLISSTLAIFYNFEVSSPNSLTSMRKVLDLFQKSNNSANVSNLISLISSATIINFHEGSLATLDEISQEKDKQELLYSKVLAKISPSTTSEFIKQLSFLQKSLFSKINQFDFQSKLIAKLLDLKCFSLVIYEDDYEEILIQHFWKCFKRASNGHKHIGEIQNAYKTLQLVNEPSPKIESLIRLVDAIDELSHYSIYFKAGTPLIPVDLLSFDNITVVIQRVLELNSKAYHDDAKLLQIGNGIAQGLGMQQLTSLDLKCLCVESALGNDDFSYAFQLSNELLDGTLDPSIAKKWMSFFQVGKYISPEWIDDGPSEDVLRQQLDILAKVLNICPSFDSQIVIAQWNSLEMDLSSRKENVESDNRLSNNDKDHSTNDRSLDFRLARALNSSAKDFLKDNKAASGQISNLLVNGLGWAIGAKNSNV